MSTQSVCMFGSSRFFSAVYYSLGIRPIICDELGPIQILPSFYWKRKEHRQCSKSGQHSRHTQWVKLCLDALIWVTFFVYAVSIRFYGSRLFDGHNWLECRPQNCGNLSIVHFDVKICGSNTHKMELLNIAKKKMKRATGQNHECNRSPNELFGMLEMKMKQQQQ